MARRLGLAGKVKVGLVTGDDILDRLDELIAAGHPLANMETGRPLADIRDQVLSANAYLGMAPIVEALDGGADVVITGRVTDTGLTLGPIFHEFGWSPDDWDKVAAGTVAGHIIECGAQCSGGNLLRDWRKVQGSGESRVSRSSRRRRTAASWSPSTRAPAAWSRSPRSPSSWCTRWAIPRSYITPDGVADFTTIRLAQAGRGPGAGERDSRRPPHADAQGVASPTSTATRRSGRWSTPGPTPTTRRGRPTASSASGSRTWGSSSSRSSPSSSASTRPTAGWRARPIPTCRRSSSGSGCGPANERRSSGSPGRSRRWCSPARRASPGSPAGGRR